MIRLTVRDLQYRSVRFAIAVLGTSLVFALTFIMSGLSSQFRREPKATVDAIGAQAWIVKDGVSGPFTSAAPIPASLALELPGDGAGAVAIARHVTHINDGENDILLFGFQPGRLGEPTTVDGRPPRSAGEIVASKELGAQIGDRLDVGSHSFEVVGLTDDMTLFAGMPLVHLTLDSVQDLVFEGRPVATALVADAPVVDAPPGTAVVTNEVTAADAMRPIDKAVATVDLVQVLLWIVAASIIGAVVYLSAIERLRDFAVFKAVGVGPRPLLGGLVLEAALVALIAVAVAAGLQAGLRPLFPMPVSVPGVAFAQLPAIALVVGLLASVAGIRQAVRVEPALAFAGQGA